MNCVHRQHTHTKFKGWGRCFVEFWYGYFRSTGLRVRDLPVKHFMSAVELVTLSELATCTCKNLLSKLYPEKAYCNICEIGFPSEAELKMHMRKHELRLECMFCPKDFGSKCALLRHVEIHTEEYKCKLCSTPLNAFDLVRHNNSKKHLIRLEAVKANGRFNNA